MKRTLLVLLPTVLSLTFPTETISQWGVAKGPYGGFVHGIAATGATIVAGTESGIFTSTDGGRLWTETYGGVGELKVEAFTISNANIFGGTEGFGVLRSTDNGLTWFGTSSQVNADVNALTSSENTVIAGTFGGVFRSTNAGSSWQYTGLGITTALTTNGTDFYAGTYGGGVFLSSNDGSSWTAAGVVGNIVLSLVATETSVFAGTAAGLFRTTNQGATWVNVTSGLGNTGVNSLAWDGVYVFAGTGEGVYRTSDNGATWTSVSNGLVNTIVLSLAASGADLFAGTYGGGVFHSANDGGRWRFTSTGITDVQTDALLVDGETMYAGTTGGVYRSSDNGKRWTPGLGLDNSNGSDFVALGSNVFVATFKGVFVTSDDGLTWTHASEGLPPLSVIALAVNGSNLFASVPGEGVFLSTDNGVSWDPVDNGLPQGLYVWDLASSGGSVFAGTGGSGVYRTTNNGASWSQVNNGMGEIFVYTLGVHGTSIFAGTAGLVFRSTNNGNSWEAAAGGIEGLTAYSFASNGTDLFAGMYQFGVYRSTDNGENWTNYGLSTLTVHSLVVNGVYLFAGVEHDALQRRRISSADMPAEVATSLEPLQPVQFALGQNYPNPFNPVTTIQFSIPEDEHVTLTIFDINGSEIARLVDESLTAGIHERKWNARAVSSGVYFSRLEAGGLSEVRRLTLIR